MKTKVEAVDLLEIVKHERTTSDDTYGKTLSVSVTLNDRLVGQTGSVLENEHDRDMANTDGKGQKQSQDDDVTHLHQHNVLDKEHSVSKEVKEENGAQEHGARHQREDQMVNGNEEEYLWVKKDVETDRHQHSCGHEQEETGEITQGQLQIWKEEEIVGGRGQAQEQVHIWVKEGVETDQHQHSGEQEQEETGRILHISNDDHFKRKRNIQKHQSINTHGQEQEQDQAQYDESSSEAETTSRKTKRRKKNGVYQCPECSDSFPSQKSLSKHRRSHKLTCVVCEKLFTLPVEIQGHMREHEGEEMPYWCDKCDKKYDKLVQLQTHRNNCGRFECSECEKVFVRKDNFKEHMSVHADSNKGTCEVCGKQFLSSVYKTRHMILHTDAMPFECVVCDKRFKFKGTLNYHMKEHTGMIDKYTKAFKCDVCGKVMKGEYSFKTHMDIHNDNKEFACTVCGKKFTQASSRDGHERTHYNKTIRFSESLSHDQLTDNVMNSFDCTECLLSFTKQIFLDEHMKQTHDLTSDAVGNTNTFSDARCTLCDDRFTSTAKLNAHYLKIHCQVLKSPKENNGQNTLICADVVTSPSSSPADKVVSLSSRSVGTVTAHCKQYGCNFCNKTVTAKTVSHHMRNHGEKKFVCRVCGVTFYQMPNLKRHMTLHTNELPYACPQCDRKFRTSDSLKKHKASHGRDTGLDKKYGCDTCGKMFLDNYHLDRHKITHMKKYRCGKCKIRFVDVKLYEEHMLTHNATDPSMCV